MTDRVRCFRYPCSTAYLQGSHVPDADGMVIHTARVSHECREPRPGEAGLAPTVWHVELVATDDNGISSPWFPRVWLESGQRDFFDSDDTNRFGAAIHQASSWALKANLREAREEALEAREAADELADLVDVT